MQVSWQSVGLQGRTVQVPTSGDVLEDGSFLVSQLGPGLVALYRRVMLHPRRLLSHWDSNLSET